MFAMGLLWLEYELRQRNQVARGLGKSRRTLQAVPELMFMLKKKKKNREAVEAVLVTFLLP